MNNKTVRSVPRIIIGNPLAVCAPATTSDRRYFQGRRAAGGGWREGLNRGRDAAEARQERETLIDDFSARPVFSAGDLDPARNRTRPVTYLLFLGINAACRAALNSRSNPAILVCTHTHVHKAMQFPRNCMSDIYIYTHHTHTHTLFCSFTSTTALKREILRTNVWDKSR